MVVHQMRQELFALTEMRTESTATIPPSAPACVAVKARTVSTSRRKPHVHAVVVLDVIGEIIR